MLTEPLTGARKPEQTDGPLGGVQISNAVDDLAPITVPRYATTAERDDAYADYVTAGGTLENGMTCYVGNDRYRRYNSAWKLDTNNAGVQGAMQGTAAATGTPLLIKTYRANVVLNSNGDGTVIFPGGAFPNGVQSVHCTTATGAAEPILWSVWGGSLSTIALRGWIITTGTAAGSLSVTTCVTAIGW